jgi:gamma-glutamyltranspeptidase/glutathione hydrolase
MSFGLMGGGMQAQGHVQLLLNLFTFGMSPQQAVDAARVRHLSGLRVGLEPPFGEGVRRALAAMGHVPVSLDNAAYGGAQLIIRLPRGWVAASDPRKDGLAIGY